MSISLPDFMAAPSSMGPSCLQGLSRYGNDLNNGLLEADYIVVEMANQLLGKDWMPEYVAAANSGGIERVLV